MAEPDLAAIRGARRELDAVIDEIRAVPGFEAFLAAPTFDDVAVAAGAQPLVYVTPAEPGGLALIVRGRDVEHVALDALTSDAVRDRVTPYLDAYAAYRADHQVGRASWRGALDTISSWAWDSVVGPILEALRHDDEVVVIAGGLLGLLPLHAAFTDDAAWPTGRRYALDSHVFSYAPNARALTAARDTAASVAMSRTLVVVEPKPVTAPQLAFAAAEAAVAAAAFPTATVLAGGEATVAGFRREAQRADVLHLACHGVASLDAPLDSGLLLAGNQWVTLRDLFALQLRVRLVVLSACETALPGTELPDEVVALPTGLLQAGAAGVVASQWAVPDLSTAILMTEFYRRLRFERPAFALRGAQQWVRDSTNGEKFDRFKEASSDVQAWLPSGSAETLMGKLEFREPDARGHADLRAWAGFAHVGV